MSTVNERLRSALLPIVPIVEPDVYKGNEDEYIVFSMSDIPVFFGDNEPEFIRHLISVNWYLPHGIDYVAKKRQIANALAAADFSYPTIVDIGDEQGAGFCFETEAVDGNI